MKAAAAFAKQTSPRVFRFVRFATTRLVRCSALWASQTARTPKREARLRRRRPLLNPRSRGRRAKQPARLDLAKDPTLYVVGYAHLDTQWRWEYPQVINEFIANTLHDNFKLIEKYPHYIFNFSGANRYRFMKEYYPADYAKLKKYIAGGRWFPAGSSMEESDVNSPLRRIHLSPGPLRQRVLSARIRQVQR